MTHFSWMDGSIVGIYLLLTIVAGISVRKYVGRVDHFLMAGREMNTHLGIASLAATDFGIVTCMYGAQMGYDKGFAGATVGLLYGGAMLLVGLTGFCIKPLRDAGVMTIPQLFERKFGPKVRWTSGVVIVLGGLLNMGVFLRTGGDFLILVCGFDPRHLEIIMALLLLVVAVYTILGGMLSVLVTDYLQYVVMSVGLIVVSVLIFKDIGWERLCSTVEGKYQAGGFNPFINRDMGWSWVLFNGLVNLAAVITWQTTIQRVLAAKDTKTGQKIYVTTSVFCVCRSLIPCLWGIAALAILPAAVAGDNSLLAMPRFLGMFLPVGILGLLVAAMLAADMSTDSSYMLTWASVIYNDILRPFRKKPWPEAKGVFWNRVIVGLIGLFLLLYGLWYPLKGDLWSYIAVTGTIYLSSMSVLLIACCYWKRANSWGAAAAIICGAFFPIAFLVMEQLPATSGLAAKIGPNFSGIAGFLMAAVAMIAGSWLKPRRRELDANPGVQP
jgi:SSS family solute:Na+ symporter